MVELEISQNLRLTYKIDRDFRDYHSLRNENCKFSKLNGLSEFSRTSNSQNSDYFDRDGIWYEQVMSKSSCPNVKDRVVPLMSVDISSCILRRNLSSDSHFANSKMHIIDCDSLSNKLNYVLSPNKSRRSNCEDSNELRGVGRFEWQSRKRLTDSALEGEYDGKRLKIAKKYDLVKEDSKIQVEDSGVQNLYQINANKVIGVGTCGVTVNGAIKEENLMDGGSLAMQKTNDAIDGSCGLPNFFMKFDVFDYEHKAVDVFHLSIVEPAVNKDNSGEFGSELGGDKLCNKLDLGNIEAIYKDKISENQIRHKWKLILLDCPIRAKIGMGDINLVTCSSKDPRIKHLLV